MPLSTSEFVTLLIEGVPEAEPVVEEHVADQGGELLLHLLMGDLRRLAIAAFDRGDGDLLQRLLSVLDAALRDGDERVENAVAVSFVEDTGWWEPEMQPFMATWPNALQAEAEKQKNWGADRGSPPRGHWWQRA